MRAFRLLLGPALASALSLSTPPLPSLPRAAQLTDLKRSGALQLWDSARPRASPTAVWQLKLFFPAADDMQRQLGLRTQRDQDLTFRTVALLAVGGVAGAAWVDSSALPPPLRQLATFALVAAPYAALAAVLAAPDGLTAIRRRLSPAYRRRQNYHEAGHLVVGYALGMEVAELNGATADGAAARVEFVSPWGAACRTHDVLDALAVLSMGGIAGEVLACGDAEGGYSDVAQLRRLMEVASPPIETRAQQDDRIRWATLMALTLLQNNRAALDAVVQEFDRGDTNAGACIVAMENATTEMR